MKNLLVAHYVQDDLRMFSAPCSECELPLAIEAFDIFVKAHGGELLIMDIEKETAIGKVCEGKVNWAWG